MTHSSLQQLSQLKYYLEVKSFIIYLNNPDISGFNYATIIHSSEALPYKKPREAIFAQ